MEKFLNNKINTLLVSKNDSDYESLVPIVEESMNNYNKDKPISYRKRKKYYRK